jgi:uncharacterized membrane protein
MSSQPHFERETDAANKPLAYPVIIALRLAHVGLVLAIAWIGIKLLSRMPYTEQARRLPRLFAVLGVAAVVPELWIRHIATRAE